MWFLLVFITQIVGSGMAGIQGPLYIGTGCFHRRKLIYGFSLDNNADVQGTRSFFTSLYFIFSAIRLD